MIGAIVGDIAGSRFEWHNRKSKRFTFLKGENESRHPCRFTDDSVMTLAVADSIRNAISIGGDSDTIGAICGAVAGAYYSVSDDIRAKVETFLDTNLLKTLHDFDRVLVDSVADVSG